MQFLWKAGNIKDCIQFSKGLPFCIGRITGGNLYWYYRFRGGSTFYFLWNDTLKNTNEWITVIDAGRTSFSFTHLDNTTIKTSEYYNHSLTLFTKKYPYLKPITPYIVNTPITDEELALRKFYKSIKTVSQFMELSPLQKLESIRMECTVFDLPVWDKEVLPKIGEFDLLNEWINMAFNLTANQWFNIPKKYIQRWIDIRKTNNGTTIFSIIGNYFNRLSNTEIVDFLIKYKYYDQDTKVLNCKDNYINKLSIPDGCKKVLCANNTITNLVIPNSCVYVNCNNNNLTKIEVSQNCKVLKCINNPNLTNISYYEGTEVLLDKNTTATINILKRKNSISNLFNMFK